MYVLQDVEIMAALGHEGETRLALFPPIPSDVRVCEMLTTDGLEVLDVDYLA